jgi:hypothetical protein
MFDTTANLKKVYFVDAAQTKLVVQHIYVINTLLKLYTFQEGSLGVDPNDLRLANSSSIGLLLFLRNGNVALLNPADYGKISWNTAGEHYVVVKTFSIRLISFGQLKQELGL